MRSVARAILQLLSRRRGARAAVHPARLPDPARPGGADARGGGTQGRPCRSSRCCASSRPRLPASPRPHAHLEALARRRHGGGRHRPAGRAVPRARSTASTRRRRRSRWRARSAPGSGVPLRPALLAADRGPRLRRDRRGHGRRPRRPAGRAVARPARERRRGPGLDRPPAARAGDGPRCSTRSRSCSAPGQPPTRRWRCCARTTSPGAPLRRRSPASLGGLFADEGLLILDPRDARVAGLAAPIYREALERLTTLGRRLEARARGAGGRRLRRADPDVRARLRAALLSPRRARRALAIDWSVRAATRAPTLRPAGGWPGADAALSDEAVADAVRARSAALLDLGAAAARSCKTRCSRPPPTSAARPR